MSQTIDNKVVEMQFDNQEFEKNVKQSMSTLDKLKECLNFDNVIKAFDKVDDAARNMNFDGATNSAGNLVRSLMSIGVAAATIREVTNIIGGLESQFISLVKSVTFEPLTTGFKEYETQINATQTILANTSGAGKTIKDVNAALNELNTYADKTIYNFTEMTKNIGTFTAAGVDLDTSVAAIKGIANLAAVSGSTSQQASTAMYQLSQALASGTVKLQDWNSVVNAGMGGKIFQDALMETARVNGILIDQLVADKGSFRETLSTGWLTSDILTDTLEKFTGDLNAATLAAQGYTQEQIDEILKMGEMANDAATKVKTFTQLKDTLAEAAQSGWTQSWQYIIGDFEQAKELWTGVSDSLGAIIQNVSDRRNRMLEVWSKYGGRDALIEGLSNSWNALLSVVTPIAEAWDQMFDRNQVGFRLRDLTKQFAEFTEQLKPSEEAMENIRRTFKGVFAILDIGRQFIGALFQAISPLFSGLVELFGGTSGGILEVTGSIGDMIVAFDEWIKKNKVFEEAFHGLFVVCNFLTEWMYQIVPLAFSTFDSFGGIVGIVNVIVAEIGQALEYLISIFGYITGLDVSSPLEAVREGTIEAEEAVADFFAWLSTKINLPTFDEIADKISEIIDLIANINIEQAFADAKETIDPMIEKLGGIEGIFNKIGAAVMTVAQTIKNILSPIIDYIKYQFSDLKLMDVAETAISGAGVYSLLSIANSIKGAFGGIEDVMEGVTGVLDGVNKSLTAWQNDLKADMIMKIAIAIGILSIALFALAALDGEEMTTGLVALSAVLGEVIAATAAINNMEFKGFGQAAGAIILISIAIGILAGAMAKLSVFQTMDETWPAVTAMTAIIAGLTLALKSMTTSLSGTGDTMLESGKGMLVTCIGLIFFATAVNKLVDAVGALGSMDLSQLKQGLVALGFVLGEMAAFIRISDVKGLTKGSKTITALAFSMILLSLAVRMLGTIDLPVLIQGIASVGFLMLELGVAMKIIGSVNMKGAAASIIAMALALNMLVLPIYLLGSMDLEVLKQGMLAIGAALLGLSVILAGMAGALKLMKTSSLNLIAVAAAFVILAAAINLLVIPIRILGAMDLPAVGIALLVLVGAFAALGALMAFLAPLGPALITVAGSFALFGAAAYLLGAGLLALTGGITALLVIGTAGITVAAGIIVAGVVAIIAGLAAVIPAVTNLLVVAVDALCAGIVAMLPSLVVALDELVYALLEVLADVGQPLIDMVVQLVEDLLVSLADHSEKISDAVVEIIYQICNALDKRWDDILTVIDNVLLKTLIHLNTWLVDIVVWALDLIIQIGNALIEGIPELVKVVDELLYVLEEALADVVITIIDIAFKLLIDIINGLADKIYENSSDLWDAVGNLIEAIIYFLADGLDKGWQGLIDIGGEILDGIIEGARNALDTAIETIKGFFGSIVDGIKDFLGINSPSTVFYSIGDYCVQGFHNAIRDLLPNVIQTAKDIVDPGNDWDEQHIAWYESGAGLANPYDKGFEENCNIVETAGYMADTAAANVEKYAPDFYTAGSDIAKQTSSGVSANAGTISTEMEKAMNASKYAAKQISFTDIGRHIISGIQKGIDDNKYNLNTGMGQLCQKLVTKANSTLGIESPSKEFAKVGKFIDLGLVAGLEKYSGNVEDATEGVSKDSIDVMKNSINKITDFMDNNMEGNPVISPVLDLTNIQNGVDELNSLFDMNNTVGLVGNVATTMNGGKSVAGESVNVDSTNKDVVDAITSLAVDVRELQTAMESMQIVMDTKTLVGQLVNPLDRALARRGAQLERGV